MLMLLLAEVGISGLTCGDELSVDLGERLTSFWPLNGALHNGSYAVPRKAKTLLAFSVNKAGCFACGSDLSARVLKLLSARWESTNGDAQQRNKTHQNLVWRMLILLVRPVRMLVVTRYRAGGCETSQDKVPSIVPIEK